MIEIDLTNLDQIDISRMICVQHEYPPEVKQIRRASECGDLITVKSILESCWLARGPRSIADTEGLSLALQEAASKNHLPIVDFLVSHDVQPSMDDVVRAVKNRWYGQLNLYLAAGWDINKAVSPHVPPPLGEAVEDLQLTKWLLARGADPNALSRFGTSPLSYAMEDASMETILLLFEHGGSVQHGQLLQHAVLRKKPDCLDVLRLLLEKGAPINQLKFDNHKRGAAHWQRFGRPTPLQLAAEVGRMDVVEFLLEMGADPLICDTGGRLALDYALYGKHDAVAQRLRSAAAASAPANLSGITQRL